MEIFTALGLVLSTAAVVVSPLHIIYIHMYSVQVIKFKFVRGAIKNHEFISCCCSYRAPLVIRGENLFPSNRLNFHISINSISSSYRLLARKRERERWRRREAFNEVWNFFLLHFFFVLQTVIHFEQ